jgi:hypothetical protein
MAMSNAERQRRYRRRQKAQLRQLRQAQRPRSRAQRWTAAVEELQALQEEYQGWLDNLPDSFRDTSLGEKLEAVCSLDLDALDDIELPRGWGKD